MADISAERKHLMTKVSVLYYIDGLNQQQIADKLNISRPQISRLLNQAKAEGIVTIRINDDFTEERELASWLCRTYGLKKAVIVNTTGCDRASAMRIIASSVSEILESLLEKDGTVAVSAGNSVSDVCRELHLHKMSDMKIVPLVGSFSASDTKWQANVTARMLAAACGCHCMQMNSPVLISSDEAYRLLVNEPEIKQVLDMAKDSAVALTGIGPVSNQATIFETGFLDPNEIAALRDAGAVASICCSFVNKEGREVSSVLNKRMIGLDTADLARIPNVIAISWGAEKAEAIHAALMGDWMDIFVTTLDTAKLIAAAKHTET